MAMGTSNIDLYEMPPLTAETMDDNGAELLREAVLQSACREYVRQVRAKIRSISIKDAEDRERALIYAGKWFKSADFKIYAGETIDGDKIVEVLKYNTPDQYLTESEREAGGLHLKDLEKYYLGKWWYGLRVHNLGNAILFALSNDRWWRKTYRIVSLKRFTGDRETDNEKVLKILDEMQREVG